MRRCAGKLHGPRRAHQPGPPATAWIADGLPQMLAAKLSRSRDVEVIPPDRMRQVRERVELPPRAAGDAVERGEGR
jgi:hypothetical protein